MHHVTIEGHDWAIYSKRRALCRYAEIGRSGGRTKNFSNRKSGNIPGLTALQLRLSQDVTWSNLRLFFVASEDLFKGVLFKGQMARIAAMRLLLKSNRARSSSCETADADMVDWWDEHWRHHRSQH